MDKKQLLSIRKNWKSGVLLFQTKDTLHPEMFSAFIHENGNQENNLFLFQLDYSEPPNEFEELARYVYELDEFCGRKGHFQGNSCN